MRSMCSLYNCGCVCEAVRRHGGSHCSPGDIMSGANAMNNIDDAGDIPGAAGACLFGGDAPYHAAPENIVGPCPNPEAHGANNDLK